MRPRAIIEEHVYVDIRVTTFHPTCSCGWRSSAPCASAERARDLWEYHVNRVHKGEPR